MKKRGIKWAAAGILSFLALIGIYLALALALSLLGTGPETHTCEQKAPFFVATTGIHLEIVLPRDQLPPYLEETLELPERTLFVAFGWGERDFYLNTPTWKDLKPGRALKALLIPSPSALHVSGYAHPHPDWNALPICEGAYAKLNSYITSSFSKGPDGRPLKIDHPGYNDHDAFYEANRRYSCYRTCNNWVNQALRKAGLRTAIWSPFEFGVLYHLP